jgi:hypothetical protein
LEELGAGLSGRKREITFKCERFCKKTPRLVHLLETSETETIAKIIKSPIIEEKTNFKDYLTKIVG